MTVERDRIRMRPNRYQPTRAEVEEVFGPLRKADGTAYTIDEAARTLMRQVAVVWDPEA